MIKDIHFYLSQHLRDYSTDEFTYKSYNSPNTMYQVSNDLDHVLLLCSPQTMRLWHLVMSRVKRNMNPVKAISLDLKHSMFTKDIARNAYFKGIKELVYYHLLLATPVKSKYIINITYANKLYKPKFDK